MTHFILHSLCPFAPVYKIIDTEACGDDSKVSESEGSRTLAMSGFAFFFFFSVEHYIVSILERD